MLHQSSICSTHDRLVAFIDCSQPSGHNIQNLIDENQLDKYHVIPTVQRLVKFNSLCIYLCSITGFYFFSGICIGFPTKKVSQPCPQEQDSGIGLPYSNHHFHGCFHFKFCVYIHQSCQETDALVCCSYKTNGSNSTSREEEYEQESYQSLYTLAASLFCY